MADATDKEPTMEEILASIRRIISEEAEDERVREPAEPAEDEPAAEAPDEVEEDEPAEEPVDPQAAADALFADEEPGEDDSAASLSEPEGEEQVAGETTAEEAAGEEAAEEDDVFELTEPADEEPADDFAAALAAADEQVAEAEETPASQPEEEAIVSPPTEVKVSASFAELSAMLIKSADGGAPTLEGLVREMLKPMMRAWLDENLPRIVEDMVAQEIARLAARSRRR